MLKRTANCKKTFLLFLVVPLLIFPNCSSCVTIGIQVSSKDNSIRNQGIHATAVHHLRWRHKPPAEVTPNRNGNKILCEHRTPVSAGNWFFFLLLRVGFSFAFFKVTMPVTRITPGTHKKRGTNREKRIVKKKNNIVKKKKLSLNPRRPHIHKRRCPSHGTRSESCPGYPVNSRYKRST